MEDQKFQEIVINSSWEKPNHDDSDKPLKLGKFSEASKGSGLWRGLGDQFYYFDPVHSILQDAEPMLIMVDKNQKDPDIIASAVLMPNGRLKSFIVDSDHRRQGYGEKFLRYAIKTFKISSLLVYETNHTARRLYDRLGFKEERRIKMEDGDTLLCMQLEESN